MSRKILPPSLASRSPQSVRFASNNVKSCEPLPPLQFSKTSHKLHLPSPLMVTQKVCKTMSQPRVLESAFNSRFDTSIVPHPLTPKPQTVQMLQPLIKRCSTFYDYEIIEQPTVFTIDSQISRTSIDVTKKTETLTAIFKIVNDPIARHFIYPDTMRVLIELIRSHIMLHIPTSFYSNPYGESIPLYTVTNWAHVELCHQIYLCIIPLLDHISPTAHCLFIKELLKQLNTPVAQVQSYIEKELSMLCNHSNCFRKYILKAIISKVIAYLDNATNPEPMAVAIRLCTKYFKEKSNQTSHNLFFKRVFYPLYGTDQVCTFEKSLNELSQFFQSNDKKTAIWCFKYLVNHWPITSPKKQSVFFQRIQEMLQYFDHQSLIDLAPDLVRVISYCIASPNVNVGFPALITLIDQGMIGLCLTSPQTVVNHLLPALNVASTQWNAHKGKMASDLIEQFKSNETIIKFIQTENTMKENKWEMIKKIASQNGY